MSSHPRSPGFTAESAIGPASRQYVTMTRIRASGADRIVPQQENCYSGCTCTDGTDSDCPCCPDAGPLVWGPDGRPHTTSEVMRMLSDT